MAALIVVGRCTAAAAPSVLGALACKQREAERRQHSLDKSATAEATDSTDTTAATSK